MRLLPVSIYLCLCWITGQRIAAQEAVISGYVYDGTSSEALTGANIVLKETAETATSNEKGGYTLKTSYEGTGTLSIFHIGYTTTHVAVSVKKGQAITASVHLTKAETTIGEVVVTGTGTEHYTKDAPVQTEVISGKALKEFAGRDIEDVLGSLSPSFTYNRGDMGSNIKINGLKNDYILILIDGKRMNGDVGGQNDLNRINLNHIERIEIVKGAVSPLYGSDAIGGVINFISKKNRDKFNVTNHTRIGGYGDIDQGNSIGLDHKKWNSSTAFDYKHTDGWRNTTREWYRSKLYANSVSKTVNRSSSYNITENLSYQASKNLTITGNASYYEKWTSRPTGNPQWRLYDFYYRNQTYGIGTKYNLQKKNYIAWDASYDKYDYFYDYTSREYTDYFDSDSNRIVYYTGDRILQTSQKRLSSNMKSVFYVGKSHTFSAGLEYMWDKLVSPYRLEGDEAGTCSLSAYAQDEWNITDKFVATAGLRIGQHKEFGQTLTPKLSAMHKWDNLRIRATYSNGFKAPTIKELYYHYYASIMSTYKAYYGNTGLEPQKSDYYALNFEYTLPHFKLNITGYQNRIRHMIALQTVATSYEDKILLVEQTMKYVNMGKACTSGIDATADAELPCRIKISGGYSFLNAKAQRTDDEAADNYLKYSYINGTSRHNATFRASWSNTWHSYKLGIGINGRYQSKTYYTSDGDAKGYQIWRLNTSHLLVDNRQWNVDANLGIDNIFDYIDRTPLGRNRGTTSPGRTVYASVSLKFKSSDN
ncbi:MAG: TonB-dependent receptor [Breznakibacter sp.]